MHKVDELKITEVSNGYIITYKQLLDTKQNVFTSWCDMIYFIQELFKIEEGV